MNGTKQSEGTKDEALKLLSGQLENLKAEYDKLKTKIENLSKQEELDEKEKIFTRINIIASQLKDAINFYWEKYPKDTEKCCTGKLDFYIEHNYRNPRTRQTEEIEPGVNQITVNEH